MKSSKSIQAVLTFALGVVVTTVGLMGVRRLQASTALGTRP
jgi:hypothetical protein